MKIGRILPVVGMLTLLACGAGFSQSPHDPAGRGHRGRSAASGFPLPQSHKSSADRRSALGDKSREAGDFAELLAAGQRQGLAR